MNHPIHDNPQSENWRQACRIQELEEAISDIGVDIHMAKVADIAYLDLAEEKIAKLGLVAGFSTRNEAE